MRSAGSEGEEKMGANVEVLSESVRPTPKGSTSERLKRAVHRHRAVSRKGIQERLFTFAFSGLVYPQIWRTRSSISRPSTSSPARELPPLRQAAATS